MAASYKVCEYIENSRCEIRDFINDYKKSKKNNSYDKSEYERYILKGYDHINEFFLNKASDMIVEQDILKSINKDIDCKLLIGKYMGELKIIKEIQTN